MTINLKYNFDSPTDYSFDSAFVEISNGEAKLRLANNPNQQFQEDFDSSTGFTFDPTKVQFLAGRCRTITQRPPQSTLAATFSSSTSLSWGSGQSLAPISSVNNPTIGANGLDLRVDKSITYDSSDCYNPIEGAFKFKLTPGYSGTPAEINQFFFFEDESSPGSSRLFLQHEAQGFLRVSGSTEIGNPWQTYTFGTWAPVQGQTYEFELNWDFDGGDIRLFIDGVQFGNPVSRNGSSASTLNNSSLRIGGSNGSNPSFEIDDILLFRFQQHTSDYTPGYTVPEKLYPETVVTLPAFVYASQGNIQAFESIDQDVRIPSQVRWIINGKYWDGGAWVLSDDSFLQANSQSDINAHIASLQVSNSIIFKVVFGEGNDRAEARDLKLFYTGQIYSQLQSIKPNTSIPVTSVAAFTTAQTNPPPSEIKYQIEVAGILYYWDGAAWLPASTLQESNTVAEVQDGLADLPIGNKGDLIRPLAIFSSDGTVTPTLDFIELAVNYDVNPVQKPPRSVVFGSLLDIIGIEMTNRAWLRIVNDDQFFLMKNSIQPGETEQVANDEGIASVLIVSTASIGYKYSFYIDYLDKNGVRKTKTLGKSEVPDNTAVNIADLTFEAIT